MKLVKFLFLAGVLLGISFLPGPARPQGGCTQGAQAGVSEFVFSNPTELIVVKFEKEFCALPIPVATGSEEVGQVRVGVVTPSVGSFFVSGTVGETGRLYWHALPPTAQP